MKKDLLNRTWKSPEQTVITYMRKKQKTIYIHPCIIESSSCTRKLNVGNQLYPQYKITIQLQTRPELGLGETTQSWPYELDMWYAVIFIWHLQRFSLSRTQSSNPPKGAWPHVNGTRWKEKKDHRLIRAIPSIQTLGISEKTGHTAGEEQMCGLCVHRILTHVDGMRPTQSPDPAPGIPRPLVRIPCLCWLGP